MEQVNHYIKRVLVFGICVLLYFLTASFINIYILIPVLLLTFSLLHARITEEKPPHLFAFDRTETYFKKGGLRDFIRILVTLFGFLYDTIIWTVWGIYLVFLLFIDLVDLLKTVFFWLIHAVLWFLRQYVPFIIFLYKIFIHYLIRWPWWLYQIAYFNIRYAFNRNCYRIALWGTLMATFIIFAFYYLELIILQLTGITFIGVIIALLPLAWSFGEIAALRVHKLENENYRQVKIKFQNGVEAVRSILFYIMLFVVLLLAQMGLNLLGWIPEYGISLGSMSFDINTLFSIFLIFLSILIVFGVIIIPSYRLYTSFSEIQLEDTSSLLGTIFRKILQYITVMVPNAIFSGIILVLPVAVILLAGIITYNLKNSFIDLKIDNLKTEQANLQDPVKADAINNRNDLLENLKEFPMGLFQELEHRDNLKNMLIYDKEDLQSANADLLRITETFQSQTDTLRKTIRNRATVNPGDPNLEGLHSQLNALQKEFRNAQAAKELEISKIRNEIDFHQQRIKQIPLLFLFGGLWLVIFGSIALAFVIAFLGNVFHQVFIFRNDQSPSEWQNVVRTLREKDNKQPLLGGTLFVITMLLIYFLWINAGLAQGFFNLFAFPLNFG